MSKGDIIYSSDGSGVNLVKKNKKKPVYQDIVPAQTTLKLRIEKKGRGGKSVTVIFELPENPDYFKKLAKKLKSHCGTGGSFKEGQIEIQGDQREKIRAFLIKEGFTIKG
ncbi:translation initiation factor [Bacteriovorax sp. DB6_IX]|uniref:translation initiation factor n=1 Tax=Bacteriovorax sp. DB6_IX TaxID=1353530 RepID=UPI00038A2840|nr:translation initiation factor [Bacteriovorax sp. DB6_IX]EQC52429.1 putative translation initiation factor SUI1 [Bacteriovorax sp. DB6_IX]